jgi:L-gulonolactone oxidase
MINVGSISDQTLAGIVTTASHGSGINYGVLSTHVTALTLLLADGSRTTCSRHENVDIFMASICGLGSTGLILAIKLVVEPAFRLREIQETFEFDHVVQHLDRFVFAAEYVRFWWFPTTGSLRVSSLDRTHEVRSPSPTPVPSDLNSIFVQPKAPAYSWLWHSLLGHHLIQLLLFIARYFLVLNTWTGYFAAWLIRDKTVGVDDSHVIFNVDCRVCVLDFSDACFSPIR